MSQNNKILAVQEATFLETELVNELKETIGLGHKDTKTFMAGFLEHLTQHLKAGNKVQLTGFGIFIEISASTYPAFKPGKSL